MVTQKLESSTLYQIYLLTIQEVEAWAKAQRGLFEVGAAYEGEKAKMSTRK